MSPSKWFTVFLKRLRGELQHPVSSLLISFCPPAICWRGHGYFLLFICSITTRPFVQRRRVLRLKHKLKRLNLNCRLVMWKQWRKANKQWTRLQGQHFLFARDYFMVVFMPARVWRVSNATRGRWRSYSDSIIDGVTLEQMGFFFSSKKPHLIRLVTLHSRSSVFHR